MNFDRVQFSTDHVLWLICGNPKWHDNLRGNFCLDFLPWRASRSPAGASSALGFQGLAVVLKLCSFNPSCLKMCICVRFWLPCQMSGCHISTTSISISEKFQFEKKKLNTGQSSWIYRKKIIESSLLNQNVRHI